MAPTSIALDNVSKIYRLYPGPAAQMAAVLGLDRLIPWRRTEYPEFPALDKVTLTLRQGERVGVVGRNGSGKTTMLKLITGNFMPTSGRIEINGKVQALMQTGLGFHPEFTGMQNIRSSLLYNGLSGQAFESAVADVADFVELGDFLHQPVKTYSLGMNARLQFAAATAICPEVLIIDEVLGAGDAYFSAKSAVRMEKVAESGCTLLLASHAMPQVLQFCERALWLENGRIVLEGDALTVVKAYEEFMQRLRREAEKTERAPASQNTSPSVLESRWLRERIIQHVLSGRSDSPEVGNNVSAGGASRWQGEGELRIESVRVLDKDGEETYQVHTGEKLSIEIKFAAETGGEFTCSYVVVLFTEVGQVLMRHCSEPDMLKMKAGASKSIRLEYPQLLLGNGKYVFTAGLYSNLDLANLSTARFYDLLSRSFTFEVRDEFRDDPSLFHHPSHWVIEG